ncbi:MAG: UDP-N-acetylmuramate:L-alanyl-gamma-D-glutamyl-meso-diaminopimelate ligase [Pseudomonadales bacterium]
MHLHILGICGTLMGSIALLAREQGYKVSGSDEHVYPPMSDQLRSAGIELRESWSADNIDDDVDLVIVGNANLPRGNPALEYTLDRGLPYTSGAEWLGRYLLPNRWVIAVAGTHGKTTTASMIAWILEDAGLSPGFLIGGVPNNFPVSARIGKSPFFVIEADEYDTSYFDRRAKFLHYRPRTTVLNNLEYDHADIYPDLAAIEEQFHLLIRTIPSTGLIIHPANDANLERVLERGCWTPRLRFDHNQLHGDAEIAAKHLSTDGREFKVLVDRKEAGIVSWDLTGTHNLCNGLAAIAAARHAGVSPKIACQALSTFRGVKRRMEVIFEAPSLKVYDDFAHHPTAIQATLEGLRKQVGNEPILAIIEPASHTMRNGVHQRQLKASVQTADHVIWYKPDNVGWDMHQTLGGPQTDILTDIDDIIDHARSHIMSFSIRHVVIMSNSGFNGFHKRFTTTLEDTCSWMT